MMRRDGYPTRRDVSAALLWLVCVSAVVCVAGGIEDRMDAPVPDPTPAPPVEMAVEEEQEDPLEAEKIDAALLDQGYYREDVPLDFVLQDILYTACEKNDIPREIGLGLIEVESGFFTDAVSPSGCYGLCQLNPRYFPSGLSAEENILAGMDYLGAQLERYDGNMAAALTAYNAGHDTGSRTYAEKVLAAAEGWRDQ